MKTIHTTDVRPVCDHCGEACPSTAINLGEKIFCCEGCRTVYQLLDRSGLCAYYQLNQRPGVSRSEPVRDDKFAFLDDEHIAGKFVTFRDEKETHICFYLPHIHCSSCLYLLENLHRVDQRVVSSRVDFEAREITVVINADTMSIRSLAALLTDIGYEPYISLRDLSGGKRPVSRGSIYRLGVAGFCFANIMLLSFPEYLGLEAADAMLRTWFRWLSLGLSLPVILFSAQPFYINAWKGLRARFLNIDAPIVLAIWVTFGRSLYEVLSGAGSGFFDSMSGIVFFMLAGRMLQDRTQRNLSFERDYRSYFPIAVTVVQDGRQLSRALPDVRCGDTLLIHHGELAPADGIITRGKGVIDYSFVTGESLPVPRELGELVYAGGRQTGGAMELLVVKEVAQSYLTGLWNRQEEKKEERSFIHLLSRRFTYLLFTVAAAAALWWWIHDPSLIGPAVTAVLIVACPCALLLSSTFTNGNILRILGYNGLYLRSAASIEKIAATTHIVFDKTGTLTKPGYDMPEYQGTPLRGEQLLAVAALASQSGHPLSKALARHLGMHATAVQRYKETAGAGIEGWVDGAHVKIGSWNFVTGAAGHQEETRVCIGWNGRLAGSFVFRSRYREGIGELMNRLRSNDTRLSLLSGDNSLDRIRLQRMMGEDATVLFNQRPEDKAGYVRRLQADDEKVMMIGDGLNDAGALRDSNAGIALTEDCNNFTPASDAILVADALGKLPLFIRYARMGRNIILASFILSVLYNVVGLSFAVRGHLSPLIAAILMPASSLSILLVTYGAAGWCAAWLGLRITLPRTPGYEKDHVRP